MLASPKALWDNSLLLIKDSVTEQQYNTWFKPIVFESYKPSTKTLLVQVPSPFVYEYLEQNFVDLLSKVLHRNFGEGIRLTYRVVTDKEHKLSQDIEADPDDADMAKQTRECAQQTAAQPAAPQQQEDIDTQLDPKLTFNNYMEGDSNKLPRSVGLSIAEHPNTTQFNPMFIYGPSGSGKTHLVNAIGLKAKQMYPQKRVLYVSARLFQTQYTDAVLHNASNDFINFYQSIDMLIVDDIQEWAGKAKTLNTFFHIFNHLFRNGKRIILACDRPPVELKDMPDRLLTRFSCGLIRLIQIRIIRQQLRTVVPGLKLTGQAALGVKNLLDRFPFVVFIELVQPEIIMRSTICIVPREGNFLVLGIGLLHILKLRLARTARIAGIKQSRFIRVSLYFAADRAFIALIMRVGRLVIRILIHVAGVFLRRC